jgi:hypothetical protein
MGHVLPHESDSEPILELTAQAETLEMLERIKRVLDKHLLQFTTKVPGVTITWTDSSVAS